jgi:PEP-CTERM motif-containing protein
MKTITRCIAVLTLLSWSLQSSAGLLLSEGFDDITTLAGAGWSLQNNSDPLGDTGWFQGSDFVFPAYEGCATCYIGANFNNTGISSPNTISNWLITPELSLSTGDWFTFFTRTVTSNAFPERLEVRLSTNGSSTDVGGTAASVGDFTSLLLEINPNLNTGGYPDAWAEYNISLPDLGAGEMGRLAFRYFVTDGGPGGANSNYIGIDSVQLESHNVPVPATLALFGLGLAGLGWSRRKKA